MKVSGKILLFIIILSGSSALRCGAAVYHSNGSQASVRALHNLASDGDTITLPAGTFSWTSRLEITKGITLKGATTIIGPASSPTVVDATIIQDNTQRSGSGEGIIKVALSSTQSFRLTGITFKPGSSTTYASAAILLSSSDAAPNTSMRVDHCHFNGLYQGKDIFVSGWVYGVADHNVFSCRGAGFSFYITHATYGGTSQDFGNGAWADYPWYGTSKFFFIEDNTIKGSGTVQTSGTIDCDRGGRYVLRHNYFRNAQPSGHGTEGGVARGMRAYEVYDNVFYWTITHSGGAQRSGTSLWHDNTWIGMENGGEIHTPLANYREISATSRTGGIWGNADGTNPWDVNDTEGNGTYVEGHQPFLFDSGSDTSSVHSFGVMHDSTKNWTPNQWVGYSIKNTNRNSVSYNKGSYITGNTSNRITYVVYSSTDRGPRYEFNAGDTYQIHRILTQLDQSGRGKGDQVRGNPPINSTTGTRLWTHEALEPCYSWNNVHTPSNNVYGYGSGNPTEIPNRDYYNLGAGFPANTTPPAVSATYTAALNGVDYVGPFVYPHPLVLGVPRAIVTDFNDDGSPDFVLERAVTHETAIWYLNNNLLIGGDLGPTLPPGWELAAWADFDRDSHADYALVHPNTGHTAVWYMSGPTPRSGAWGPMLPNGWELVAAADFNGDSHPDYVLYNARTRQTAIWYLSGPTFIGGAYGPTLPNGWRLVGVGDFDRDGHTDYLLFYAFTGDTAIWYLSGPTLTEGAFGPTVPSGWVLVATADFDGDSNPDYLLYNGGTHGTAIWYLNNNVFVNSAYGPTLPAAWSWVEP
jgi:FG-GAP-like repeat